MKKILILALICASNFSYAQKIDREELINDIRTLSSPEFEGRKVGTPGNKKAAEYIIKRFMDEELSFYQDSFKHPFTFKNRRTEELKGTNLIGYIKGRSDDVIVITAHYDHVGINGSDIYHGADDNASGVGALLAIADYFEDHKPRHTLLFIAFDAEEAGLQGAFAFLKNPIVAKERIKLNVNMDMVGRNAKGEFYASGTYKHPEIKQIISKASRKTGVDLLFGHDLPGSGREDWTMQSDQGPFAQENIPFVYFGVEDHADYHKPTDTFDKIDQNFYHGSVMTILRSIIQLDKNLSKIKQPANAPVAE